jgi:hypothetical protein
VINTGTGSRLSRKKKWKEYKTIHNLIKWKVPVSDHRRIVFNALRIINRRWSIVFDILRTSSADHWMKTSLKNIDLQFIRGGDQRKRTLSQSMNWKIVITELCKCS